MQNKSGIKVVCSMMQNVDRVLISLIKIIQNESDCHFRLSQLISVYMYHQ